LVVRIGSAGWRVGFVHRHDPRGLLIEKLLDLDLGLAGIFQETHLIIERISGHDLPERFQDPLPSEYAGIFLLIF
jgi:hypothetical protein